MQCGACATAERSRGVGGCGAGASWARVAALASGRLRVRDGRVPREFARARTRLRPVPVFRSSTEDVAGAVEFAQRALRFEAPESLSVGRLLAHRERKARRLNGRKRSPQRSRRTEGTDFSALVCSVVQSFWISRSARRLPFPSDSMPAPALQILRGLLHQDAEVSSSPERTFRTWGTARFPLLDMVLHLSCRP